MDVSNFERKKAGAGKLEYGSWDLYFIGAAPENLHFQKIYDIIEVAYYRAGARKAWNVSQNLTGK